MGRDARTDPLAALVAGRWRDWRGWPADLDLQGLERAHAGSTLLDRQATLGRGQVPCQLSSLGDLPVLVWHRDGHVLRVDHDCLERPLPAPSDPAGFARFDVVQGAQLVPGGEWVDAALGLALLVTAGGRVIEAAGFAPTTLHDYEQHLRPSRRWPVPMPQDTQR